MYGDTFMDSTWDALGGVAVLLFALGIGAMVVGARRRLRVGRFLGVPRVTGAAAAAAGPGEAVRVHGKVGLFEDRALPSPVDGAPVVWAQLVAGAGTKSPARVTRSVSFIVDDGSGVRVQVPEAATEVLHWGSSTAKPTSREFLTAFLPAPALELYDRQTSRARHALFSHSLGVGAEVEVLGAVPKTFESGHLGPFRDIAPILELAPLDGSVAVLVGGASAYSAQARRAALLGLGVASIGAALLWTVIAVS